MPLEFADPDGFRVWKLNEMGGIPIWSAKGTALLGDACHPLSPSVFSGASMAIEDGATLATLLPTDALVDEIPNRLELYEEIRKKRLEEYGRRLGPLRKVRR
jgi:2-polyprenyl-6-methoxyphenol hydroxylase-like FAD-dependent oxidoreductase